MGQKMQPEMTISMRTFIDGDDEYGVQVYVTGLPTQAAADKAMAYMQGLLCADEKTVN